MLGQFIELLTGLLDTDGVPLADQLDQLTQLFVLRFAQLAAYSELLPEGCNWQGLMSGLSCRRPEALDVAFVQMRDHLSPLISASFQGAIRHMSNGGLLHSAMNVIDGLSWTPGPGLSPGAAYGALIGHYAALPRSGVADYAVAGDVLGRMVQIARPLADDLVVDPAAGCASLLVAAGSSSGLTHDAGHVPSTGRHFGLLQRPRASRTALANLLLNGLAPVTGLPILSAPNTARHGLALLPTPTLIVSDLARLRLSLSRELGLIHSAGLRLRPQGRAVIRVTPAVGGNDASVKRLRADWIRVGLHARFQSLPGEGLLLHLHKAEVAQRKAPPRRAVSAWPCLPLAVLLRESRHGVSSVRRTQSGGVPLIRVCDVESFSQDSDALSRVSTDVDIAQYAVQRDDLLVVRAGALRVIGNCCRIPDPPAAATVFSDKLIRLRVDTSRVLPEWIAACLNEPTTRRRLQLQALSCGGQYRITRKLLLALPIPVPTLKEQHLSLGRR